MNPPRQPFLATGRKLLSAALARAGFRLERTTPRTAQLPVELRPEDGLMLDHVLRQRLSMASVERLRTTLLACTHVAAQGIQGSFVECGVWRGGNSLIAADVFSRRAPDRHVYLFDTFAGMTAPTDADVDCAGAPASAEFTASQRESHNEWCYASLDDVQSNFRQAGLLGPQVHFIQGDILQTLRVPANLPERIAVLRLDTDWYESTLLELEILYPRLAKGGVLIIDDYGHWGGARKAVDEYFADRERPFFQFTDYTGRAGVKP
jgi:O-methyltransferase